MTIVKGCQQLSIVTISSMLHVAGVPLHGIIGVHRSPLDTKAPGPPLIYLVGPLAILDPHINICVRPLNTCVALKQFHLLPPNTSV